MKNVFIEVALVFILFAGCSTTYRVNDFSSKGTFFAEFNDSFKTKDVNVTLSNDSTFITSDCAIIISDTLTLYNIVEGKHYLQIALSNIAEITYSKNDYSKASILLKNGDELKAENVNIVHDSINFVEIKSSIMINNIPIDKVKTASYTSRWKGVFSGMKIGFASGSMIGYLQGKTATDYHGETQELSGFLGGAILGIITCGVGGYFIGCPIIYEFNK